MVFDILKLLMTGNVKFQKGRIVVVGNDVGLLPLEFLAGLLKYIKNKRDKKELSKLYLIEWISGLLLMNNFSEKYKVESPEDRYLLGMEMASFLGFGEFKTLEYDIGEYALFEVINNPFVKYFYPSTEPIDLIISGFQAGGGCIAHNKIIQNVELKCGAVSGEKNCLFLNATLKEHKKRGTFKILKERIDLNYLLPIQKKIFTLTNKKDFQKILEIISSSI